MINAIFEGHASEVVGRVGEAMGLLQNPLDARATRSEILDRSTGQVWQSCEPTTRQWFDALKVDAPLLKLACGSGSMDRMWFRRSPGAEEDGPPLTREIGGCIFFYCARPVGAPEEGPPRLMVVDKHHSLGYDSGRDVEFLTSPGGSHYVRVVDGVPDGAAPELPLGWSLLRRRLEEDWEVDLPTPTETFWFEGMVSYQGPVELPPQGEAS
jgi:hypothetical protein